MKRDRPVSGSVQNSSGFRFECQDDSFDFGRDSTERGNGWMTAQNLRIAERYINGDLDIAVKFRSMRQAHEFDLICRRKPSAISDPSIFIAGRRASEDDISKDHFGLMRRKPDRDQHAMRVGIPYLVECPQQSIPSLIWVERSQERTDFRRITPEPGAVQFTVHASSVPGKGESSFLRVTANDTDSGAVNSVIKCVSQIGCRIFDNSGEITGDISHQLDLVDIKIRLRIMCDDHGVWICSEKGINFGAYFIDVIACAVD